MPYKDSPKVEAACKAVIMASDDFRAIDERWQRALNAVSAETNPFGRRRVQDMQELHQAWEESLWTLRRANEVYWKGIERRPARVRRKWPCLNPASRL
jgi:hypothetical protein